MRRAAAVRPARRGPPTSSPTASTKHLLRQNFINVRRVREWRDIHTQLHTVVAEHKWRLNAQPASYEQLHLSMLAGLLGNIGCKSEDEDWYLGARGIKFHRHPGAHLKQEARAAGSSAPSWWRPRACSAAASPTSSRNGSRRWPATCCKKQLLDPHWEKKAAEVMALERATLYGLVVYSGRRVNFGQVDPQARARDLHPRGAGGRPVGHAAAVPGRQPQADRAGRGAGAQVAPAGRAGGRRADLRLLRPAAAAATCTAATASSLVPRPRPAASPSCCS